jgi:energy-coupling factor transporter ATP-binding protein EcfA2
MEAQDKFESIIQKSQGYVLSIIGKPGSGKTTLIKKLIKATFKDKYSYILLISPSQSEYEDIIPATQMTHVFSIEWLYGMINMINTSMQSKKCNVLLILDDCIGEIKESQKNSKIVGLFFNRRHLLWNGTLSYIMTAQKYTMIPAKFRSCITDICLFNLSPFDMDKIFEESVIKYTHGEWQSHISKLYDKDFEHIRFDIDKQIIN